jgi:predicted dithiol-disulfide oxidoreductase (DUF899 family)
MVVGRNGREPAVPSRVNRLLEASKRETFAFELHQRQMDPKVHTWIVSDSVRSGSEVPGGRRFPGESYDYRRARQELLQAEIELRGQIEDLAVQRRALPQGGEPAEYVFDEWDARVGSVRQVRHSELFDPSKDDLLLYSFMFRPGPHKQALEVPCPICTSIIDGIDGAVPHITQRINFAVVAKAPIERFAAHARARGWRNARLLSSANSTYNLDYRAETVDGEQFAMATTFQRRHGTIRHVWSSELWYARPEEGQNPRHVDFMWPMWSIFDRIAIGRGTDWMPKLSYRS